MYSKLQPSAFAKSTSLKILALTTMLGLAACGQDANPQIAMCHSVVEKAIGKVEWGDTSVKESNIAKIVTADYTIDGDSGTIDCTYGWQRIDSDNGQWATAPTTISVNGEKMSIRDLASASFSASGDALKTVADETAKETRRLAGETAERATELAEQAGERATELAGQAGELASEAGEKIGPAAERANEIATEAAKEAARKLQEVLQNQ